MEHNISPQQLLGFPPIMDREKFAAAIGVEKATLDQMISRDQIPVIKTGARRSFVNCVLLAQRCLQGGAS